MCHADNREIERKKTQDTTTKTLFIVKNFKIYKSGNSFKII